MSVKTWSSSREIEKNCLHLLSMHFEQSVRKREFIPSLFFCANNRLSSTDKYIALANFLFICLFSFSSPVWSAPLENASEQSLTSKNTNETAADHSLVSMSNNNNTPIQKGNKRVLASTFANTVVDAKNKIKAFTDATYWTRTSTRYYLPSRNSLEW